MNKIIWLALLALCINIIKGRTCAKGNGLGGDNEDTCQLLELQNDKTHCCYIDTENSLYEGCQGLTDDQYENIKKYKDYLRYKSGDEDLGIECSSRFVSLELFALLSLLLI